MKEYSRLYKLKKRGEPVMKLSSDLDYNDMEE